jgi:beta-glucanase (GH16 family)
MLPSTTRYGGWASGGEIDILEALNSTDRLYQTIHYGGSYPNNVSNGGNVYRASTFADGFHTYAVEWEPDSIRWYFNGVQTFYLTSPSWYSAAALWNQRAPFDEPFHLLLNLAVGGNWPGSPNLGTPFPAEMQVDWVRCYQRSMEPKATNTARDR